MAGFAGGHRWTLWLDDRDQVRQVSVACIDDFHELLCEVTEEVGPFDDLEGVQAGALARAHALGGWRAHQGFLLD